MYVVHSYTRTNSQSVFQGHWISWWHPTIYFLWLPDSKLSPQSASRAVQPLLWQCHQIRLKHLQNCSPVHDIIMTFHSSVERPSPSRVRVGVVSSPQIMLQFLSIMIVSGAANAYLFIVMVFVIVAFILLRSYYLRTSREVKRLEAVGKYTLKHAFTDQYGYCIPTRHQRSCVRTLIPVLISVHFLFLCWLPTSLSSFAARSPLFSHISTTLTGLATIRSLKRQQMSLEWYHTLQDDHTTGWNSYIASTRWFGLRVDAIGAAFVGVVAFMAIPLADCEC